MEHPLLSNIPVDGGDNTWWEDSQDLAKASTSTKNVKGLLSAVDLVPAIERKCYSMDESASTMDDDLGGLQGNTLVPNSPYLSCPTSPILSKIKLLMDDKIEGVYDDDDLDMRGSPLACIFVASLNKIKSDEELHLSVYNCFVKYGDIISVKVFRDWLNRPYAFRTSHAKQALEQSPGALLNGRRIRCEKAKVNRTLYLSSLHAPLIEKKIEDELSNYGQIEDIQTGQNDDGTFCAYVKFFYREDAIQAFLNTHLIAIKNEWTVEWCFNINNPPAMEDSLKYDRSCLFVGNLDKTISQHELKDQFQVYGNIEHCTIIKKSDPRYHVTFGFVKYTSVDSATRAMQTENGRLWHGHILRVSHRKVKKTKQYLTTKQWPLPHTTPVYYPQPHPPGLGMAASDIRKTAYGYRHYRGDTDSATNSTFSGGATKKNKQVGTHVPQYYSQMARNVVIGNQGNELVTYHHPIDPTFGGACYWYPNTNWQQWSYDPYYQMYPHAGVYVFPTLGGSTVPCMEPSNSIFPTTTMMIPIYPPIHSYARKKEMVAQSTTNKGASTKKTCDLVDDDK
ncbi:hypothetical protein BC941DRAFT_470490 [Chlamydoabsidia padenii]|nr:hypothetical protein BC941DRAFT_470490 [Chlamydoabsidia padenii]